MKLLFFRYCPDKSVPFIPKEKQEGINALPRASLISERSIYRNLVMTIICINALPRASLISTYQNSTTNIQKKQEYSIRNDNHNIFLESLYSSLHARFFFLFLRCTGKVVAQQMTSAKYFLFHLRTGIEKRDRTLCVT